MTRHQPLHAQPFIDTNSTRQLVAHIDGVCMRHPDIGDAITAIRAGDNDALLTLVTQTREGNSDAALVAIGALLPRLCKVIISRAPVQRWKSSIDDYIPIAYLVILDVSSDERGEHLADKIIARTRRRHERYTFAHQPIPFWDEFLIDRGPVADDTERRVIARLELAAIGSAINEGVISSDEWQTVVATQIHRPLSIPASDRERRAVSRARQRLERWSTDPQAA